jgi:hypothetical protein
VPVPETAMYEDDGFVSGQYDVWFAGKFGVMQPIPEAFCKQKAPHQNFRFGVFAPDAGHVVAAGCRIVHICHRANLKSNQPPKPKPSLILSSPTRRRFHWIPSVPRSVRGATSTYASIRRSGKFPTSAHSPMMRSWITAGMSLRMWRKQGRSQRIGGWSGNFWKW